MARRGPASRCEGATAAGRRARNLGRSEGRQGAARGSLRPPPAPAVPARGRRGASVHARAGALRGPGAGSGASRGRCSPARAPTPGSRGRREGNATEVVSPAARVPGAHAADPPTCRGAPASSRPRAPRRAGGGPVASVLRAAALPERPRPAEAQPPPLQRRAGAPGVPSGPALGVTQVLRTPSPPGRARPPSAGRGPFPARFPPGFPLPTEVRAAASSPAPHAALLPAKGGLCRSLHPAAVGPSREARPPRALQPPAPLTPSASL